MADPNDFGGAEQESMDANEKYRIRLAAAQRTIVPSIAASQSDFVRNYPGVSPDLAAATMDLGELRDHPGMAEIIRRDYAGQGLLMRGLTNLAGPVTRPLTAGFYDVWDMSVTRWQRFAVQQYQNPENHWATNFARAGTGIMGEAQASGTSVGDMMFGGALGTGLIAGRPEDPMLMPGAGRHFENQLEQGAGFDEALSNTEEWVTEKYGANIVADAWQLADETLLHVTNNGIEYEYGVSAGRLAVTPLFQLGYVTPHTLPANLISGAIDFYTQIAMDPMDPWFNQATRWYSVRKALRPTPLTKTDEVIAVHGGVLLEEKPMRGKYHGDNVQDTQTRNTGMMSDDYVFHGGPEFDPETGLGGGGISLDLERAIEHAHTRGGDTPTVYAIRKEDLTPELVAHLEEHGEIEQLVVTQLDDTQRVIADDHVHAITNAEALANETDEAYNIYLRALRGEDSEFDEFMYRRDQFDELEGGPTVADGEPGGYPGEIDEYVINHFDKETAARYADLKTARNGAGWERKQAVLRAGAIDDPGVRHVIGQETGTLPNGENVPTSWPAPITSGMPVAHAEEMLGDGYFYAAGIEARDAARKYIDEDLGVVKVHGRWEAKDPEEWLRAGKGDGLAEWVANPAVPYPAKLRQLRSMGVPTSAAVVMIDDVEAALRAEKMIPNTKYDVPESTYNDFHPLGPAADDPHGGLDNLIEEIDATLDDFDSNFGAASDFSIQEVEIQLSRFQQANPQVPKSLQNRINHVKRIVERLYVEGATPEEVAKAQGLVNRKLRELSDDFKKTRRGDADRLQASLDRYAMKKPEGPFVEAAKDMSEKLYRAADEVSAVLYEKGDKLYGRINDKIGAGSEAKTGVVLTPAEQVTHLEELVDLLEEAVRKTGVGNEQLVALRAQLDELRKLEPKNVTNFADAQAQRIAATAPPRSAVSASKEHLTALVNGRVITRQASKPGRLGRAMSGDTTLISGEAHVRDTPRAFSDWGRRWRAHSTESRIDAWDFDTTFDSVTQFLETIRSTPKTIDRIVRLAAANYGSMKGSLLVLDEILLELEAQLVRKGMDERAAMKIVQDYLAEQRRTILYHVNLAGNPIGEADSLYTLERTASGLEFKVMLDEPINDAEMSISSIHMPSVRDARRVTSTQRVALSKLELGYNVKLGPNVADRYLDGAAAIWRNLQLLRPGWMMSVIPDEIGRMAAQGHVELLSNPMFAWRIMMGEAGDLLPSMNGVAEVAKAQGGLGAGRAPRSVRDEPMLAAHAAGRTSWEVKMVVDPDTGLVTAEGAKHIARNYVRLWQSQLYDSLYQFDGDIERTIEWLTKHPDGKAVLRNIAEGQGRGAIPSARRRIGRATQTPVNAEAAADAERAIRIELEALNGEVLLMTGGDYVKRNVDRPGEWLNSGGGRVETYEGINPATVGPTGTGRKWTEADLWEEIRRRDPQAANRFSAGGKPVRVADLKARLMQMDGVDVDLARIPENQSYVTVKEGDGRLKSVIGTGRADASTIDMHLATNQAYKRMVLSHGFHQENTVLVRMPSTFTADGIGNGTYQVYKTPNMAKMDPQPGEVFIIVDTSKLDAEEQFRFMQGLRDGERIASVDEPFQYQPQAMRRLSIDEMDTKAQALFDTGDVNRIFDEMETDDFEDLARFIEEEAYTDGVKPPARVKGPSSIAEARLSEMDSSFIDTLFTYLGQKPSELLVRNPYARIKTWETFADFYIYATPTMQAEIRAAAEASNIPSAQFDKFVQKSLRQAGVADGLMPTPAVIQLTMEEMEGLAVANAIQEARDLFFDLSKRGNWADATKLIFPFGDAWWEVLTRWGRLFNPVKAEEFGRPFKNLHRIQQATMSSERSGWFETNEKGDRVFRWFPGAALATAFMDVPEGFQMRNTGSISQLMFIDFSDARSVLAPGMGPYMQIPAAAVRSLEGTAVQSWIDWAVFGSFDPGETDAEGVMNMLIPTWMKKVYKRMQGGAYSEDAASLVTDIANALYATGDPKYADVAIDRGVQQKLLLDARHIADTYLWVEMFASSALPMQPKAVTELVNTTTEGTERVVQLAAVADDFYFLNQYMETEQARATIIDWYGEDPTMIAPKSYGVLYRPVTKEGYEFVTGNNDFMDVVPLTAAAFMPMTPGEVFYSREYKRQINSGDRQKLTPEEAYLYLSYRQGQARFYEVKDEMDRRLEQAEAVWGKDSDLYRAYRDGTVAPWYANAKMSLEAMYYGYSTSASGATKLRRRPTNEDLLLEMIAVGTPGSAENEAARNVNRDLTGYLEKIAGWWNKNSQISIVNGVDASWWYSSATQADPTPQMLRDEFQYRVQKLVDDIDDPAMAQRVKWYTDSIMTPLMQGYDLDRPFIVNVDPLLAPEG